MGRAPLRIGCAFAYARCGTEAYGSHRMGLAHITDGRTLDYGGTQAQFVPQMINFELIGGVDFHKGCYPGQEVIARMHYRGALKRRMMLAHTADAQTQA